MVFSYKQKVIISSIKHVRIKYRYGARRIVNDHPEYEWNVNGVNKLLKKIDETGDVARKENSGRPKSVRTEENIEPLKEWFLAKKISQELILH